MKNYLNYINERYEIEEGYEKLAINLMNAHNNDDWDKNMRKLIGFDFEYDYDIKSSWNENILQIELNSKDLLNLFGDFEENLLSTLSEWTSYNTPETDKEEINLEYKIGYFDDETKSDFKKLLSLFEVETTDKNFDSKLIIFFELFENCKFIEEKKEQILWDFQIMIEKQIVYSAHEIDSRINFEFGFNSRNYPHEELKYDTYIKIDLLEFNDEKTVKEFILKSKNAIEDIENFQYEYTIKDDELKKTNKEIRDYDLKKLIDHCELYEEDLIFEFVEVNDDNIKKITEIGGLFNKVISDYKTQKEYITYYDGIDDIEIDEDEEKIKRIKNLLKNNSILPKIKEEFGYLVELEKFNI